MEFTTAQQREEAAEQKKGIAYAKECGLKKTVKVIEKGGCYKKIFKTAIKEVGVDKVFEIVCEAEEKYGDNAQWAYEFACCAKGLKRKQNNCFIDIIFRAEDSWLAYCYARDIKGLTRNQVDDLIWILEKNFDAERACEFILNVKGLQTRQVNNLISVVINGIDGYFWAQELIFEAERLTKRQKKRLRAVYEE